MKSFNIILIVVLFIFSNLAYSSEIQKDNKTLINSIFFHIYNQDFDLAEKEIDLHQDDLTDFTNNWLSCDLMWWKAISKADEGSFDKLQKYLEDQLNNINKDPKANKLMKMVYINYLMRLAAIKNQSYKTLKYFLKINKFHDKFDSDSLDSFQKDLYNIFHAVFVISKNDFLFFNKEKEESYFKTLDQYANSNQLIVKTMAQYFLVKIYLDIKETPQLAKTYLKTLCSQYPNNKVFMEF
jgi:hypothetical protein